ncbi:DNA polymerase III subunit gamma and tau, partial [Demequina phytophila]|uniref:DNA polymerase III subunit gamma and tau n=1 Tax=Demequina phytophila TaxID=1638981 RepID=UPI0012DFF237
MTTALYRRYRPDAFADVVGQEHVTTPLMQALRADRVNHAYLFSGPRGCGKTTSARILARCLNCVEGPTDTPCGTCPSCVELARGGAGSVDVVEIDAASHNGVDDARELRERAAFAPARDRYKIFILDEAHMVTTQGFNALLKLVEEPPPHVRFIFATTEPEKVIGTIRSRTHHYPFRLVPPPVLSAYLQTLCEAEGVTVAGGVLDLVVRAGGGSVRDTLSVLDQLMAGSDDSGVTYDRAIALLGFTDATLLDDAVDAIAAADGASLFDVVERVMSTGHEPRRFVEDLLERLRDLLILCAAGDAGARALGAMPEDQATRMRDQSRRLGLARASGAADLVNDALTHMIGATSPRLHLELLCARLLASDPGAAPAMPASPAVRAEAPVAAPAPSPAPAASVPTPAASVPAAAPAAAPAASAPAPTPTRAPAPTRASTPTAPEAAPAPAA